MESNFVLPFLSLIIVNRHFQGLRYLLGLEENLTTDFESEHK